MPIHRKRDKKGSYYQWGNKKKYYYISGNKKSREIAKKKAIRQMKAIYASGYKG